MKIRVVSAFCDKFHTNTLYTEGMVLDFDDERANDIIRRKLGVAVVEEQKVEEPAPEPEKVEEPEVKEDAPETEETADNEPAPEVEEPVEEAPASEPEVKTRRGRKPAEK